MKTIVNTFLKGLLFALPAFITFGLIYWLFSTAEALFKIPLEMVLPKGWYVTGLGLISTVCLIFLIGLLAQAYLISRLFTWLESVVERIPFVKTLYTSAKDFLSVLTGNNGREMQRVVRITMDNGIQVIGFVTHEDVKLGDQESLIAVYVPMSYMIGGFLLYMPRHRCEPLDISVQHAMQQVLTAHITFHQGKK